MNLNGFQRHDLGGGHSFWSGQLPEAVVYPISFEELWDLHPPEMPEILIHGRRLKIPRWQQAYGVDYRFSGQVSTAQPVPQCLEALLAWCWVAIDPRLNGLLLNWYDGQLGHYIGRHRDSTRNLVPSSGIVTVSLGEERVFRLRSWPHRAGCSLSAPTVNEGGDADSDHGR
jgi:alkylated DNA repair dioxygenase AlkB